jgi:hypothetical protein
MEDHTAFRLEALEERMFDAVVVHHAFFVIFHTELEDVTDAHCRYLSYWLRMMIKKEESSAPLRMHPTS